MSKKKSYLFVLTARGGGDRPPVIALAIRLKELGHKVTVLCDEETALLIQSSSLETNTFPVHLDERGHVGNWIRKIINGEIIEGSSFINPMSEWANPLLPLSLEVVKDFKPNLIISTLFGIGLVDALSKKTGIPWCFVNPSFYFGENATTSWEEDWYGPYISQLAQKCFLPLTQEAEIVLHATDQVFDFEPTQLPKNHYYAGFLLWEPEMKLEPYILEKGYPWALITLSSVSQEDEVAFAKSALNALADIPVRTILTQPDKTIADELGILPDNAKIAGFIPHTPILKRSSIVVNHAGHGIVSKAITYGVPMVLLPWDRDQPGVANRAEKLGVARVVPREQANPEEVRQAIIAVLENNKYLENSKIHSRRILNMDSLNISCELLTQF